MATNCNLPVPHFDSLETNARRGLPLLSQGQALLKLLAMTGPRVVGHCERGWPSAAIHYR